MSSSETLRIDRPRTTLRELALVKLRNAILHLHFAPGERLVERHLCEQLGVSRTVVREVLRHLETEGLVETVHHHGPVVAVLDPETVEEVYEIRAALEAMAARACAAKGDRAPVKKLERALAAIEAAFAEDDLQTILAQTTSFYETLFLSAGKPVGWEIVRKLNARINSLRAMTLSAPGRSKNGPAEMWRIIEAIRAGNPDRAAAASQAHVMSAYEIARERLGEIGTDRGSVRRTRRPKREEIP